MNKKETEQHSKSFLDSNLVKITVTEPLGARDQDIIQSLMNVADFYRKDRPIKKRTEDAKKIRKPKK